MNVSPYPKYKPSGVEWLGDVPDHWRTASLKWISRRYAGGTPDKSIQDYWEDGTIPWLNSGAVNDFYIEEPSTYITEEAYHNSSARWISKGCLVIALAGQGKTKGMVAQLGIDSTCNQSMAAICPNKNIYPRFLLWWLIRNYINIRNLAGGDQRDGLNLEMIGSIPIPVVPFSEQKLIADFIDFETKNLDELIERKEKLIELLEENRTALISRAVTKGLNPNVRFKPSGVEWLGDVPEHWEVKKLSWLFWYSKGLNAATLTKEYAGSNAGDFPVYSGQTENDGLMSMIDTYEFDFLSPVILVTTVGAKAMTTRLLLGKFSLSQNCALIIPRGSQVNSSYYEGVLQPLFEYEKGSISLIMQPSLRFEDLNRFRVPLPPLDEQIKIYAYIKTETSKIDSLISKVANAIETLKEYRTAIISAAVTGKIDVREGAQ
jgi:type I restriction enzyme S subunit